MLDKQSALAVQPALPGNREADARDIRIKLAELSTSVAFAPAVVNGDETAPYLFSFTKGLKHTSQGLLETPGDFETFRTGTASPDPAVFQAVPLNADQTALEAAPPAGLGAVFRKWESPTAGHAFVLLGPDPQAIGMPPAPVAGSAELAAEMAELYQMALHRDLPVAACMDGRWSRISPTRSPAPPSAPSRRPRPGCRGCAGSGARPRRATSPIPACGRAAASARRRRPRACSAA